ncbi:MULTISPECIES: Csu type fimbrial protein [Dyella]|nr:MULTISPECIES: spore coat U domain-containing protein [Dyella]
MDGYSDHDDRIKQVSNGVPAPSAFRRIALKCFQLASSSLVALIMLALPAAHAEMRVNATATANFNVTLTLTAGCTIAANPLNFGSAGVLGTAINQQTTLSITCTNTTPYNVGLDAGSVPTSTIANRLMAGTAAGNTGSTVQFQLFTDVARTTIWGNTPGTDTVTGTGTGVTQTLTVYGQVPVQAFTPRPDNYLTSITATVNF